MSATTAPELKLALQMLPQEMPLGDELTEPDPFLLTLNAKVEGVPYTKVAVTARACDITTVQLPVPEQTPPQPLKL